MSWLWAFPVLSGLITLWRPRHGLSFVLLVLPSYLIRSEILGIPTTALELSIYAAAAVIAIRLAVKRSPWHWVRMTKLTWWLLGLWGGAWVAATIMAQDQTAALGALKAWLIDPLLFTALLAVVIRTPADRNWIIQAVLISGGLVAVAGLIQLVGFRETLQEGRLSSWFAPVANYAAMYLGPLFVFGVAWCLHQTARRWQWALVALMGFALVLTLSFGAYIAAAVGLLFVWWQLPTGRIKKRLLLAGVVVVFLGGLGLTQTKNFSQHFDFSGRSSGSVRQQIWVTSWALIQQHPIVGIGPNNFEPAYRKELPKHYFPPLEWLVSQPHNLYLALWLETGLIGLVVFLTLFGYHFRLAWREFLAQPGQRAITIASLAALMTILIHGFVDTPYFKNDLAVEFLFLAVLPWLDREGSAGNTVPQKQTNPSFRTG